MMTLTDAEKAKLRSYKTSPDCDDVRFKEIIKEKLLDNRLIIYVLNNQKLQEANAPVDEYYDVNILPYYLIKPTQVDVQNFICYEVDFDEESRYNDKFKHGTIVFYILCEQKNIKESITGIARHDLLAALVLEEFNWKNYFGTQIHCISDEASVIDSDYASRTLVFEMTTFNNLVRTDNGVTGYANTEVET